MHLGGGGYDWSSLSESSSEEIPVTIKIYASTGTIAYSEDLVFTPDFSITGSNG